MILCIHKEGNKKKYDLCKGCVSINHEDGCIYQSFLKYSKCPCCECIVKTTYEMFCEKFFVWSNERAKLENKMIITLGHK